MNEKYLININSRKGSVERTNVIQLSHEFSYNYLKLILINTILIFQIIYK